jgi:uncharacterized tellurite resistance protein B-like protein
MAGLIGSILNIFRKKESPTPPQEIIQVQKQPSLETTIQDDYDFSQPFEQASSSQNNSDTDQTDDEYRSITVHGYSIYDPPVNRSACTTSGMTWVGSGQSISVNGYTIRNPLTYWSKNSYPEASCIATTLKVGDHKNTNLAPLPYWPQYSGLTPAQRGKYLSWLSRGRNDDLEEIGYAFIFFYGLERRALVEKLDYKIILMEVQRLRSRYPASSSFNTYLNQFMAYVIGSHLGKMSNSDIRKLFPSFDNLDDYTTKVLLSWHWTNNLTVQWEICYSLSKTSVGFTRTNMVKRSPVLLKQLFRKKFLLQFPEGIPFSSAYDQFQLNYHQASPTISRNISYSKASNLIEPLVVPIPRLDSPPYTLLKKIWDDCIEELKPAVSRLNKSEGKITREVYSVLPNSLKDDISHPDMESWRNFISSRPPIDGSIVLQVSDIALQIGIEKRNVLTSSQSAMLTSTVRDFGWIVVPDQITSGTSYKWNDTVAIIPTGDKNKPLLENFQSAALIFEMAHRIAASDEKVSDIEENFLHKFVSEQFSLNTFEIECLKGLQKVLEIQPPSLARIGKRLSKHLNPEQKIALADFLGEIVLLDNKFVKEEQTAMKTVLKALEIDPTVSNELINKLLVGHIPDDPITVQKSGRSRKGEVIPPMVIVPEFSINREKLDRTLKDTRIVQEMLASVFDQEQEEIVLELEPEIEISKSMIKTGTKQSDIDLPFPPETIPSLDVKYLSILHDIMKSVELSQDEFSGLAKKYNLMPRAAFDDINSWADEELGDFLLEENERCIVINYKND